MISNNVIPDKGPADAFPWYQKAALKGHRTSMYSLGLCYYKGIGIDEPNMDIALEWFEKAARMGVADSMSYIGRIYLQKYMSGQTDESMQYFKTALVWLKKAADKNDTYSQRELGKMHLGGKVVEINYDLAVTLLERASQKNDPEAIFYLGECYYKGTGVVKDNETAITHYMRAASLGYPM
jgi:TPR repeat protein